MEEYCLTYLEITAIGLIAFLVGVILKSICKN